MSLSREECEKFAKFMHEEILRKDADWAHLGQNTGSLVPEGGGVSEYKAPPPRPAAAAANPVAHDTRQAQQSDWRKDVPAGRVQRNLDEWDQGHIQTTLTGIFKGVNRTGSGYLEWNNSEIKNFVHAVFRAKGLPEPNVPESVWYQIYREVDHDGNYKMDQREACEFALHCMQRILQMHNVPVAAPVTVVRMAPVTVQPKAVRRLG